jgi:hypothetical protein
LRRLGGVLAHDFLAHPQRPISDGARVLRSVDRQQLGQQDRDLAEWRQRRISGRDVGRFRRDRIMAEIPHPKALHLDRFLTRTDKQASDAHQHISE